jgi:hypothetical protein
MKVRIETVIAVNIVILILIEYIKTILSSRDYLFEPFYTGVYAYIVDVATEVVLFYNDSAVNTTLYRYTLLGYIVENTSKGAYLVDLVESELIVDRYAKYIA